MTDGDYGIMTGKMCQRVINTNNARIEENIAWSFDNLVSVAEQPWRLLRNIAIRAEARRRMKETWFLLLKNEELLRIHADG